MLFLSALRGSVHNRLDDARPGTAVVVSIVLVFSLFRFFSFVSHFVFGERGFLIHLICSLLRFFLAFISSGPQGVHVSLLKRDFLFT